jgi:hypothetical protein
VVAGDSVVEDPGLDVDAVVDELALGVEAEHAVSVMAANSPPARTRPTRLG